MSQVLNNYASLLILSSQTILIQLLTTSQAQHQLRPSPALHYRFSSEPIATYKSTQV